MKGAVLLFSGLFFAASAGAATLDKADQSFEKGLYQEALKLYEPILKDSDSATRFKALYRSLECQALLFRYAEAATRASNAALFGDVLSKARLLILRAELGREFLKQYGREAPRDEEEGSTDIVRSTPAEIHKEIRSAYRQLRGLRSALVQAPLKEESYFVDLKNVEFERTPTLWDFVVLRWSDYLFDEAEPGTAEKPAFDSFIVSDYAVAYSENDSPAVQAASLFEEASRLKGNGRSAASGLWRIRRLLIGFRHAEGVAPAVKSSPSERRAAEMMESWMSRWNHPVSRAQAGLEAARLWNEVGDFARSVEVCRRVEKDWGSTRAARHCVKLRSQIELPLLDLSADMAPPPGKNMIKLSTRNLDKVYLRVYRLKPELLHSRLPGSRSDWNALRGPDDELVRSVLAGAPDHSWEADTSSTVPHANHMTTVSPPELKPGFYMAVAGSESGLAAGRSLLSAAFLNVTELFLVVSAGPQGAEKDFLFDPNSVETTKRVPGLHLYGFDALTGRPRPAHVEAYKSSNRVAALKFSLELDELGMGQVGVEVQRFYGHSSSSYFDALASSEGSYAFGAGPVHFWHSVDSPVEIRVEFDRPIYRPGQEVSAKITVLRRIPQGYKVYDGSSDIEFTVRDPNYQEFFKTKLKPGPMGSASARFIVPTGKLLGGYHASAVVRDFGHEFSGGARFTVEEYRRPEFEVLIQESSGPWKFGEKVTVQGEARYYFGAPVPSAPVRYKVYRERFLPWFCWWWRDFSPESGRVEVFSGESKTDDQGRFSLAFTPQPPESSVKEPRPATFTVEAESRDPGGRTITAERAFKAGSKALLFEINPPSGFFTAGKPASIAVRLMNLNEQPVDGSAEYELFHLTDTPAENDDHQDDEDSFPGSPSLETLYRHTPNGPLVRAGKLSFREGRSGSADLGILEEGVYRIKFRAEDPWGEQSEQSVVILSVRSEMGKTKLPLPSATLPEHSSYLKGETARFLLGSAQLSDAIYVEIWGGSYLLERRILRGGGVRMISLPVTEDHKGGFTLRWFGATGFRLRGGQASIEVPWREKELRVKLRHDKILAPGATTHASLAAFDQDGQPVSGEAMVRVFDRSLEYYVKSAKSWLSSLYPPRIGAGQAQGSLFDLPSMSLPVTEGWIKAMLQLYHEAIREPEPPMLRLNKSRAYGHRRHGVFPMAAAGSAMAMMEADTGMKTKNPTSKIMQAREGGGPSEPAVAVRSEFADTAYFQPHLKITAGRGAFSFKAPEQLTSWNIQASVLTADVKRGTVEEQAVTRKDLMVRVELPRFYREGDRGTLKAVVHNETDSEVSGEVSLSAFEEGRPASQSLGLEGLTRAFTAPAHGLASLSWTVQAPSRQTSFKMRAVARAGNLVDAEERDLPILPSRQRLVETALIALNGSVKGELALPSFKEEDPTRRHESAHMQIDPQLALSILNSLPYLISYPHECTEQILHRYVPLAVANSFYRKHPSLASAASKIPKRQTTTPAWDRADPRRLTALMETPWEEYSRGNKGQLPVIDMLDEAVVRRELSESLEKLLGYQNADGSFPWFPGGRSDPYMTLLFLSGMAEVQRYGVEVPMDSVRRALVYVNQEIPRRLKPDTGSLSMILYAAYVVTSYPRSWPESDLGFRFAKAWADYADNYAGALTPLGKAYAAFVYTRLDDKNKGALYLDRALDGVREDPVAGAYWAPEKISWLWYNDNVETHAFLLRALQSLRPQDRLIPGMVQWLLFNRKGNEWKSTKASAAAIYSLLDVLKSRGSLEKGDSYKVLWGDDVQLAQVEAFDWLGKPLRWSKIGLDVGPRHGRAEIEKQGPGLAFASLTWIYTTDRPSSASGSGMMELSRRFFLRQKEGSTYRLKPLKSGSVVAVGDQIEVQLKLNTRSQFEYVHLRDPKLAGFEAEELLSGWKWDLLSRYEEQRDSLTNFFMDWVPHGEYILRYRLRPTLPGTYRLGSAVLQSMYAPEFSARSDGFTLEVRQ